MRKVFILLCGVFTLSFSHAQLLTWSPSFAKDNDNITITVDATKGNQGLLNFSGNVYVHIGLITSASARTFFASKYNGPGNVTAYSQRILDVYHAGA